MKMSRISRVTTMLVASLSLVFESAPAVAQTRAVTLDEALAARDAGLRYPDQLFGRESVEKRLLRLQGDLEFL